MSGSIFSEPAPLTQHDHLVHELEKLDQEAMYVQQRYRMLSDTNGYDIEHDWKGFNNLLTGRALSPLSVMCLQHHFGGKTRGLVGDTLAPPLSEQPLPDRQKVLDLRRERLDDMRVTLHTLLRAASLGPPRAEQQHAIRTYEMNDLSPANVRQVALMEEQIFGAAGWTQTSLEALLTTTEWKAGTREIQVLRNDTGRFIGHLATSQVQQRIPYVRSTLPPVAEKMVLRLDSLSIAAGFIETGTDVVIRRLIQYLVESGHDRLVDGIDEAHPFTA